METINVFENAPREMIIELLESFRDQMSNNIHRLETDNALSASGYFTYWCMNLSNVLNELKANEDKYTKKDIDDLARAVSFTMVQFENALGRSSNI